MTGRTSGEASVPRRAERLLGLVLPRNSRGEAVLGDLAEEYARRVADGDPRSLADAQWWYRRQAGAIAFSYAVGRLRRAARGPVVWNGIAAAVHDLRSGVRSLLRDPLFAIAAALVLGLGIGAATAVFTFIDRVMFRPLPYADEERIVSVYETDARGAIRQPSYPTFREWRPAAGAFEGLAFVRGESLRVHGRDGTMLLLAAYGTADLFSVLRAQPALGRVFSNADANEAVAVLAWNTWREQFGGDPNIVGRELSTGHGPVTVIGVMPREARYPAWSGLWLPIGALPPASLKALERRDLHVDSGVVGRVRDGASLDRAARELSVLAERAAGIHPDARGWTRVALIALRDELVGTEPRRFLVVASAAALLLIVAGVNVAGLLVARSSARRRELAVRVALGATRSRLAGSLIAEALVLAIAGGAAGALLATALVGIVAGTVPDIVPRLDAAAVDARALAFALAASLVMAIAFALLTAHRAGRVAPLDTLRAHTTTARAGAERLRSVLVVAEVALAVVLVVVATSLVRSLLELRAVELGVETGGVVAVQVVPPSPRYDSQESALQLYRRLEEAARTVPGARAAALVNHVPLSRGSMSTTVRTSRIPLEDERPRAVYYSISPDFFPALGIDLLRGRAPTAAEVEARSAVAVVSATLARREWPDRDPIGQTVTVRLVAQGRSNFGTEVAVTVVGVAEDTRSFGPTRDAPPAIYLPYTLAVWGHTYVVVRGDGDVRSLAAGVRRALMEVDATLPLAGPGFTHRVRPLDDYAARWLTADRLGAGVVTGFATAALVLATVGLFGVVAYVVLRRSREFAIRFALGATPVRVVTLVLRDGARLTLIGLLAGLVIAWGGSRILGAWIVPLSPSHPGIFALVALVLAFAVLAASAAPAIRAARLQPATMLRDEG